MKQMLVFAVIGFGWLLFGGCFQPAVEMSQGQQLYEAKCSLCHVLIGPTTFQGPQWREYIDKYGSHLSEGEKQLVLGYLAGGEIED